MTRTSRPHARARGFTLLEVLMVVLVVGILSAVVLLGLNPGGPERRLNDEAERLAALLSLASSEAVMQNREYGLYLDDAGYRFLCLDEQNQRWSDCTGDKLFREHELPEGLEIRVLSDRRMRLPAPAAAESLSLQDQSTPALQPDVLLLSSGEASPAELEIRVADDPSARVEIRVDEIGRVRWGEQIGQEEGRDA
ncbi:MAG: type II secretion system minor pseudopilin GspH [Gammaproteobacteria bacterium]